MEEQYRLRVEAEDGYVRVEILPSRPETPSIHYSPEKAEEIAQGILDAARVARNQLRNP